MKIFSESDKDWEKSFPHQQYHTARQPRTAIPLKARRLSQYTLSSKFNEAAAAAEVHMANADGNE